MEPTSITTLANHNLTWSDVAALVIAVAGIILPFIVAYAGNRLTERTGRVQLLEFAHERIKSANNASSWLASTLEEITFSLEIMVTRSLDIYFTAYFEDEERDEQLSKRRVRRRVEQEIRIALDPDTKSDQELSEDQRTLRNAHRRFAHLLTRLPDELRDFSNDPIVTAITRAAIKKDNSLAKKINNILGRQYYRVDPVSIAGLMSDAGQSSSDRLLFIVDRFNDEIPFSERDYLGLMFEYDVYEAPDQEAPQEPPAKKGSKADVPIAPLIKYVLINSGMIYFQSMYSLLPSKEDMANIFEGLIDKHGDEITSKYAKLTGVDFKQIIDSNHYEMLQSYVEHPEELILIGIAESSSSEETGATNEIKWKKYDPKTDGKLSQIGWRPI